MIRLDHQISSNASSSNTDFRQPNSVIELIADVARAWPDEFALAGHGRAITYRSLVGAADALGYELLDRGAGRDVPIGICIDRSIEHVVAMLGVLRAGSGFLPLDPDWPADRLYRILDDAGAPIVIAAPRFAAKLAAPHRIVLNGEMSARQSLAPRDLPMPSSDDLAYLIYTSGSTGEPKGVEVTHGNLLHLATWHRQAFGTSRQDRASWVAGLGFDASIWELFPYLALGASIHIPGEQIRTAADAMRAWLIENAITIAFAPTPMAEALMTSAWPPEIDLRFLLTGGDTLHLWAKPDLPFRVVNNYGPTECTVVATSGPVRAQPPFSVLPTIGKPIDGAHVVILDPNGVPVRQGIVGEIFVAGAGVARGYRHRPDLTQARFVTLALGAGDKAPKRYYRTGDLGSWTVDGNIAFHGRCDDQIKIRGHRIEPDEIAATLSRHPGVTQSAIVADGEGADRRLIAYVVPVSAEAPRGQELRDFLAGHLPSYMLPSAFVRIAALPLTPNGKLDKTALPAPDAANTLASIRYRAPNSSVEARLATIVEELLDLDAVGVDDNFFLLGGHSLLGTQLVLRVRDAFGVELTLRDLFEAQTIGNLAAKVEEMVVTMVATMSEEELQARLTH